MTITLVNCKPKLLAKGIDVTSSGWHELLTTSLLAYVSILDGWNYDFDTDVLRIIVPGIETVPANIVDFGDGSEVELG